jgi:putative tricarboxylic transport membrane protein
MIITRDLVGGIGAIAIGAVYYAYASQMRVSALDDTVGPAGLPKVYAILMVVFGVIIAAGALLRSLRMRAAGLPVKPEWAGQGRKATQAGGILLIGIAYILLVPSIGYAPGIALLVLATALYQGAARDWRLVAIAVAGAAVLWVIFVVLLGVSMPHGSLLPF